MARPIFSTNPSFGFLEQSASPRDEKPLPPTPRRLPQTPRRPSSVYTVAPNETHLPYDGSVLDQYFANELLQPKTYRSSASKLPDQPPIRPKLLKDTQTHAASEPIVERRRAEHNQHGYTEDMTFAQINDRRNDKAKEHAENYESLLHTRSSIVPNDIPDSFYSDHGHLPSTMSPRITDVVDESLMPSPLRFSTINYDQVESRFSSDSSSDAGSCHSGFQNSVKSYARKKFSKRSFTPEVEEKTRLTSPPKPKSRLGSIASQRRASIQHGIGEMYDTLTSFSLTPAKNKPPAMQFETTSKVRIPRERRSPAIPLTPYQMIGVKAFEDTASSRSSKTSFLPSLGSREPNSKPSKSTRSTKGPIRTAGSQPTNPSSPKRPIVKKLAAAFSNRTTHFESAIGLETNRVKRSKSEKRRAELKEKITVVGLGDRQLAGGGRWM